MYHRTCAVQQKEYFENTNGVHLHSHQRLTSHSRQPRTGGRHRPQDVTTSMRRQPTLPQLRLRIASGLLRRRFCGMAAHSGPSCPDHRGPHEY